jgi:antitoxin (DNA-binding transcriptional repressor) of toxin-antitoxin stability system
MKTASVADLRNEFPKIEGWLKQGEQVHITKRGEHIATLLPAAQTPKKEMVFPDFEARLKRIWGDRVFTEAEEQEMRDAEDGVLDE